MTLTTKNIEKEKIELVLKTIGNRIRTKRKLTESNYEDFAKKHQINKVTLSRIENGANSSLKSLIIVANSLQMTLKDLFEDL